MYLLPNEFHQTSKNCKWRPSRCIFFFFYEDLFTRDFSDACAHTLWYCVPLCVVWIRPEHNYSRKATRHGNTWRVFHPYYHIYESSVHCTIFSYQEYTILVTHKRRFSTAKMKWEKNIYSHTWYTTIIQFTYTVARWLSLSEWRISNAVVHS